eukprot:gene2458-2831_t
MLLSFIADCLLRTELERQTVEEETTTKTKQLQKGIIDNNNTRFSFNPKQNIAVTRTVDDVNSTDGNCTQQTAGFKDDLVDLNNNELLLSKDEDDSCKEDINDLRCRVEVKDFASKKRKNNDVINADDDELSAKRENFQLSSRVGECCLARSGSSCNAGIHQAVRAMVKRSRIPGLQQGQKQQQTNCAVGSNGKGGGSKMASLEDGCIGIGVKTVNAFEDCEDCGSENGNGHGCVAANDVDMSGIAKLSAIPRVLAKKPVMQGNDEANVMSWNLGETNAMPGGQAKTISMKRETNVMQRRKPSSTMKKETITMPKKETRALFPKLETNTMPLHREGNITEDGKTKPLHCIVADSKILMKPDEHETIGYAKNRNVRTSACTVDSIDVLDDKRQTEETNRPQLTSFGFSRIPQNTSAQVGSFSRESKEGENARKNVRIEANDSGPRVSEEVRNGSKLKVGNTMVDSRICYKSVEKERDACRGKSIGQSEPHDRPKLTTFKSAMKNEDTVIKNRGTAMKIKNSTIKNKDVPLRTEDTAVKNEDLAVKIEDTTVKISGRDNAGKKGDSAVNSKIVSQNNNDTVLKSKGAAGRDAKASVNNKFGYKGPQMTGPQMTDRVSLPNTSPAEKRKAPIKGVVNTSRKGTALIKSVNAEDNGNVPVIRKGVSKLDASVYGGVKQKSVSLAREGVQMNASPMREEVPKNAHLNGEAVNKDVPLNRERNTKAETATGDDLKKIGMPFREEDPKMVNTSSAINKEFDHSQKDICSVKVGKKASRAPWHEGAVKNKQDESVRSLSEVAAVGQTHTPFATKLILIDDRKAMACSSEPSLDSFKDTAEVAGWGAAMATGSLDRSTLIANKRRFGGVDDRKQMPLRMNAAVLNEKSCSDTRLCGRESDRPTVDLSSQCDVLLDDADNTQDGNSESSSEGSVTSKSDLGSNLSDIESCENDFKTRKTVFTSPRNDITSGVNNASQQHEEPVTLEQTDKVKKPERLNVRNWSGKDNEICNWDQSIETERKKIRQPSICLAVSTSDSSIPRTEDAHCAPVKSIDPAEKAGKPVAGGFDCPNQDQPSCDEHLTKTEDTVSTACLGTALKSDSGRPHGALTASTVNANTISGAVSSDNFITINGRKDCRNAGADSGNSSVFVKLGSFGSNKTLRGASGINKQELGFINIESKETHNNSNHPAVICDNGVRHKLVDRDRICVNDLSLLETIVQNDKGPVQENKCNPNLDERQGQTQRSVAGATKTRHFEFITSNRPLLLGSVDDKIRKQKTKKKKSNKVDSQQRSDHNGLNCWGGQEVFYSSGETFESLSMEVANTVVHDNDNKQGEPCEFLHYKTLQERFIDGSESGCSGSDVVKLPDFSSSDVNMVGSSKSIAVNNNCNSMINGRHGISKPSAKIKPYTVVDLSTMSTLSPEEVDNCLEKVCEDERIRWLKYSPNQLSQNDNDDNVEAPHGILPPKTFRNRSNTTALVLNTSCDSSTTTEIGVGNNIIPSSTGNNSCESVSTYSQPGLGLNPTSSGVKMEGPFRRRSHTTPNEILNLRNKARNVSTFKPPSHSPQCNVDATLKLPRSTHDSSKDNGESHCEDSRCNPIHTDHDNDHDIDLHGSCDFPPLPSLDDLKTDENEIVDSESEWPCAPTLDVVEGAGQNEAANSKNEAGSSKKLECSSDRTSIINVDDVEKDLKELAENKATVLGNEVAIPGNQEPLSAVNNTEVKQHDPHRSLPPIPGESSSEFSLSWVTKAAIVGPGPFIPMCPGNSDEIPTAHFYDDIDNIRKIAQERAEMIKRLQDEDQATNDKEAVTRTSLGEMPDVIPNLGESGSSIGVEDVGEFASERNKSNKKKSKKKKNQIKSGKDKKSKENIETSKDDLKELPLPATISNEEKAKGRSRFAKLIRKLSAPVAKNSASTNDIRVKTAQRKATTPQPTRKATNATMKSAENDRMEVFATPSATRRLFSLSLHKRGHQRRQQRQRTTSDTEIMKSILDEESTKCEETKHRSKQQRSGTISFGLGRSRKAKKPDSEQLHRKALSEDSRSVRSLEMMQINSDFDSLSSCSARITPATSPLLLTKFNSSKKYKAPEAPNWRPGKDEATGCGSSIRSGFSDVSVGCFSDPGATNMHRSDETGVEKPDQGYYGNFPLSSVNGVKPSKPSRGHSCVDDNTGDNNLKMTSNVATDVATGDATQQDEVFTENSYDNYPPSKHDVGRPTKPPRSESSEADSCVHHIDDNSRGPGLQGPDKPRRRASQENNLTTNPEPYSSQRIHRKFIGKQLDLNARFSPTLSNSDCDDWSPYRDNIVAYENLSLDGDSWRRGDGDVRKNLDLNFRNRYGCDYANFSRSDNYIDRCERGSAFNYRRRLDSPSMSDKCEHVYDKVEGSSPSPNTLRYSIDSYDKLMEIHRETVEQISEATSFRCDCGQLETKQWRDFKITGKILNFGVGSYVTLPVSLVDGGEHGSEATYTAWLRQSFDFLQPSQDQYEPSLDASLPELSSHEHLLHICKDISSENRTAEDVSKTGVPQDIHVKRMLISKTTPRMSLSKYLSSNLDAHDRDPEGYENEACLILLQILKGLRHLLERNCYIEDLNCDVVLLTDMKKGEFVDVGGGRERGKSCPTVLCLALPHLLKTCADVKGQGQEVKSQSLNVKGQISDLQSPQELMANRNADGDGNAKVKSHYSEIAILSPDVKAQTGEIGVLQLAADCLGSVSTGARSQSKCNEAMEVKVHESIEERKVSDEDLGQNGTTQVAHCCSDTREIPADLKKNLIELIFELFHSSLHVGKMTALDNCSGDGGINYATTAPELPVKSIYSKRMQFVVDKLLTTLNERPESAATQSTATIEQLVKYLELIAFCPPLATESISEERAELLIRKWRNRRCVEIVTGILKKCSLVALANGLASRAGFGGKGHMGLSRDCVLECQFLANKAVLNGVQDVFSIL